MHRDKNETDSKKRKFADEKKTVHFETNEYHCEVCSHGFSSKVDLSNHMVQCISPKDEPSKVKVEAQKSENDSGIVDKIISRLCSECDLKIEAKNSKELILENIKHSHVCKMKIVSNKTIVTNETAPSPPHKKIKDTEDEAVENEIEKILDSMEKMEVDEKIEESKTGNKIPIQIFEIKEEEMIPPRFSKMLRFKGIDITEHKLGRVSGGGRCGYNCISLHITGSEEMANEIARNKNDHMVSNWEEIYKQCYNFPYTERIGGTTKTFETEEDFLIFLLTDKDATSMWMTHASMQAVSTMLNMNISILTTEVAPSSSNSCPRCKLQTIFNNNEDLRRHTEIIHHTMKSEEEMEGRIHGARWTHLKPDSRIRTGIPNEKAEELIILHKDEIHYNIILHKSHNTCHGKNKMMKHKTDDHVEERTLFGDLLQPKMSSSWANITSINRPVNKSNPYTGLQDLNEIKPQTQDRKIDNDVPNHDNDWQTVTKKRKCNIVYNIPVQNRFEGLGVAEKEESSEKQSSLSQYNCDFCDFQFSTKSMLKTHMKIHKAKSTSIDECKCAASKDHKNSLNEINFEEKSRKCTKRNKNPERISEIEAS